MKLDKYDNGLGGRAVSSTRHGLPNRGDGREVHETGEGGFRVEGWTDPHFVDRDGKVILHNPVTHPISFDTYVTYRGGTNEEIKVTVDSRDLQDSELLNKLRAKYAARTPSRQRDNWCLLMTNEIESILCEYFDYRSVRLVLMERCSSLTGYYFTFGIVANKKFPARITLAKHEKIIAEYKAEVASLEKALEFSRVLLKVRKGFDAQMSETMEKLKPEIRYAHSNVRAGNLDAANKHLEKIRKTLGDS